MGDHTKHQNHQVSKPQEIGQHISLATEARVLQLRMIGSYMTILAALLGRRTRLIMGIPVGRIGLQFASHGFCARSHDSFATLAVVREWKGLSSRSSDGNVTIIANHPAAWQDTKREGEEEDKETQRKKTKSDLPKSQRLLIWAGLS